jgi:uncharacterized UBP type Zn finger protein
VAERAKLRKKKEPVLQSVYMSEDNRRLVEGVLKQLHDDGADAVAPDDDMDEAEEAEEATAAAAEAADALSMQLQTMGFQAKHAEAATMATAVTDTATALDWLMLHVAEAELPKQFALGAAGDPIGKRKTAYSPLSNQYHCL